MNIPNDIACLIAQCLFCKVLLHAGKQINRNNMSHRFSQCPSLSKELQLALRAHEGAMLAAMQDLGCMNVPADVGFSEDFVQELNGWGDEQIDGQDAMAEPVNNHPLARAARLSNLNDGDIIP